MQIVELTHKEDILKTYPLLVQLYEDLTEEQYDFYISELMPLGYRRIVVCGEDGSYLGSAGFLVGVHFRYGKYLYLNDLVTDGKNRSQGVGQMLMDWVEAEAHAEGCRNIKLASGTFRHDSHRFYFRNGFIIQSYYFVKNIA